MSLNKAEQTLVLEMVAQEWARLAVRHAGSVTEVDNPYFLWHPDTKRERAVRRADNARRTTLAKIIAKWTSEPVPPLDKEAFIRPYQSPHGKAGLRMFVREYARAEVRRLTKVICARTS